VFGCLCSRGPFGLALGFYRARVWYLDVAHFNCKGELGATKYGRSALWPCSPWREYTTFGRERMEGGFSPFPYAAKMFVPSPATTTATATMKKMSNANAGADNNKIGSVKMLNVNASASADNKLGSVGPLSRSTTPTLSQAQDEEEGSFPNLQERP
jgi:hypothetical protein